MISLKGHLEVVVVFGAGLPAADHPWEEVRVALHQCADAVWCVVDHLVSWSFWLQILLYEIGMRGGLGGGFGAPGEFGVGSTGQPRGRGKPQATNMFKRRKGYRAQNDSKPRKEKPPQEPTKQLFVRPIDLDVK